MTREEYETHREHIQGLSEAGDVQSLHLVAQTLLLRLREAQATVSQLPALYSEINRPLKLMRVRSHAPETPMRKMDCPTCTQQPKDPRHACGAFIRHDPSEGYTCDSYKEKPK